MKVISITEEMKNTIKDIKKSGKTVGFVPTMGYLHEGHLSLVKNAKEENDIVVVSVFVNPTQFGENEDLDVYPRDFERDKKLLIEEGVDYIFKPEYEDLYPNGDTTRVNVSGITEKLCGKSRPHHFSGVTTVVSKLFNIVGADKAYFGLKDAQQVAVIKRMVDDLFMDTEIVPCPIVREEDGLAKSSRNVFLSEEDRKKALSLSRALKKAEKMCKDREKDPGKIKELLKSEIEGDIDYIEILSYPGLEDVTKIDRDIIIALAVRVGSVRLIDNIIIQSSKNL